MLLPPGVAAAAVSAFPLLLRFVTPNFSSVPPPVWNTPRWGSGQEVRSRGGPLTSTSEPSPHPFSSLKILAHQLFLGTSGGGLLPFVSAYGLAG